MKRSLISNVLMLVAITLLALNLIVLLMRTTPSSYAAAGKIQYKVDPGPNSSDQAEAFLNKYSAEGWELVPIRTVGGWWIFKK